VPTQFLNLRSDEAALLLAGLLLFLPLFVFHLVRVRAGRVPTLRAMAGYQNIQRATAELAETGQTMHLALGTGAIGGASTLESVAGLLALDHLAEQAARLGTVPLVTVGDPALMLLAQDMLYHHHARRGRAEDYAATQVRFVASAPAAYAAGVMDLIEHTPAGVNVYLGAFGDEFLLMSEAGVRRDTRQVAGAAKVETLPFIYAGSDQPLIGEELFGAGAYLGNLPAHVASLAAQDWVRVLLILIIVAGVVLKNM